MSPFMVVFAFGLTGVAIFFAMTRDRRPHRHMMRAEREDVRRIIASGDRTAAIARVRTYTGATHEDAAKIVDAIEEAAYKVDEARR